MNQTLSSSALVIHDLGLATAFGGTLFGKLALDPAAKVLSDPKERGQIVSTAWGAYNLVNLVALGASAVTWLVGRSLLTGREAGRVARPLVVAKDILVGTAFAAGIGNMVAGALFARQAPAARVPIETGMTRHPTTPPRAASLQKATTMLGFVQGLASAGVIGITALLNFRAGKSRRWSRIARALP